MKILDKVQEIFSQYELNKLTFPEDNKNVYEFLQSYPEFRKDFVSEKNDGFLIKKYRKHISKGHYGFSIGEPIVPVWNEILDKILELCIAADPSFEIHQVKLKFGGICFYVHSERIEDIHEVEVLIGKNLFDKALIY